MPRCSVLTLPGSCRGRPVVHEASTGKVAVVEQLNVGALNGEAALPERVEGQRTAIIRASHSEKRVRECIGNPMGGLLRTGLVTAGSNLRSRDPVEIRVPDGVLSEKEAQLGRMFLNVAHIVELQLQKAD